MVVLISLVLGIKITVGHVPHYAGLLGQFEYCYCLRINQKDRRDERSVSSQKKIQKGIKQAVASKKKQGGGGGGWTPLVGKLGRLRLVRLGGLKKSSRINTRAKYFIKDGQISTDEKPSKRRNIDEEQEQQRT